MVEGALYGFVTWWPSLSDRRSSRRISSRLHSKAFPEADSAGLDLQGGLHLVYEVNVDKAVAGKVDRLASDIEDRLHKDKGTNDLVVSREGRDDIIFTFKPPSDEDEAGRRGPQGLPQDARHRQPRRHDRRGAPAPRSRSGRGGARLRPRQGIETIRGRVDKFGVSEPTIIKKGTDIIVELPGLKSADFERIKSIIGRTAQLEFKIVDDGSEYMKKVAASVRKNAGIDVVPSPGPRRTAPSRTRT